MSLLTGYSATAARVFWEDLIPVRIWVPRLNKDEGDTECTSANVPTKE